MILLKQPNYGCSCRNSDFPQRKEACLSLEASLSLRGSSHKPVQAQHSPSVGRKEAAVGHSLLALLYPRGPGSLAFHLPSHWQNNYQTCQGGVPISDSFVVTFTSLYRIQRGSESGKDTAAQFQWGQSAFLTHTATASSSPVKFTVRFATATSSHTNPTFTHTCIQIKKQPKPKAITYTVGMYSPGKAFVV